MHDISLQRHENHYSRKNNKEYAKVGLINKSGSPTKLEECIIGDTNIYTNNKDYHKFKEKSTSKDEKKLSYVHDKYGYTFEFDKQKNITKVKFDIMEAKIKY